MTVTVTVTPSRGAALPDRDHTQCWSRGTKSPLSPEIGHEQRGGVRSSGDQVYPVGDSGGMQMCIRTVTPKVTCTNCQEGQA